MIDKVSSEQVVGSSSTHNCPICGSDLLSAHCHPLYTTCRTCLTIFQSSEIYEIIDYYSDIKIDNSHKIGSYENYLKIMSEIIDFKRINTIIDVGAGDGKFLDICEDHFKERYAIETSKLAQSILLDKGYWISIDKLSKIDRKIITGFQIIEHIINPYSFIKRLHLNKDDYIVLTSPAAESIYCKLYGKKWKSLSPSHHVVLYSKRSLGTFCRELGMELLYYDFCVSGAHDLIDVWLKYIASLIKWPIKVCLGRSTKFPLFHGKNSFLAICIKR